MKFEKIYQIIENYSPISISSELCAVDGGYDNSGIIAKTHREIKKVLVCLDLTKDAVQFAKQINAELIITHHPAIFTPIKSIDGALFEAVYNQIGIISMHLNFDAMDKGIDYYLAKALGAKNEKIVDKLTLGGYGRVFTLEKTLGEIKDQIEREFNTKTLVYGDYLQKINKLASFCGAGFSYKALELQADLIVTSDIKHHEILACLESKKCVCVITHYASENYGLKKIFDDIKNLNELSDLEFVYFDDKRFI